MQGLHSDSTLDLSSGQTPAPAVASSLRDDLSAFLAPLLRQLDEQIDARLVRTFRDTVGAILTFRHRNCGLLLSELGAFITSPSHAPAGTKRLSNLLRCDKWGFGRIGSFLWDRAESRREELRSAGEDALVIWDDSVNEKHESQKAQGLCPVRSSKAKRLSRIKPGYYRKPGPPVFVPGLHWLCILLIGRSGPPCVAGMEWWSTRETEGGPEPTDGRRLRSEWLKRLAKAWDRSVLHVFDRGYAGAPWLKETLEQRVRFVQRWPKAYKLVDASGVEKKAWEISRGKRSWDHRMIRDARRNEERKVGVLAFRVSHPRQHLAGRKAAELPPPQDAPLWLVVARSGKKGQEP